MQANIRRRNDSFPFQPVYWAVGGKAYYDRAKVEQWIAAGAPNAFGHPRITTERRVA
jgi:hypothetical protein